MIRINISHGVAQVVIHSQGASLGTGVVTVQIADMSILDRLIIR
jgi:hypothetical protein